MEAIKAFQKNIERAEKLLELHRAVAPRGRPLERGLLPDVLRATVIFAVAALDSYMHDKIVENIVQVIRHCGKKKSGFPGYLINILKSNLSTEKAITLLYRKRPEEQIQKIVRDHLSAKTFQDPGQIAQGLQHLGITDLWEPLRRKLSLSSKKRQKNTSNNM